jgi:alpha-glucosidase
MSITHQWWQSGVVYQIYPRSFQDSDGDGIGDLPGIVSRLDYLQRLGVDAIWISPIYPSPMADFGYDVADYTGVDPMFGTMADFDALLAAAHERGLKLILDLVPNHSSDEHPWFVEARSSRDNPKRDWYIWRDPAPDSGPPNNWLSNFGGPAWTLDEATGQYYLHLFDPKQPDLNWRNRAVRAAIYDAMRFWYRKGVDGFRVDVIWMLIKHPDMPDNPVDPDWTEDRMPGQRLRRIYDQNQPEVHEVIREMRAVTEEFPDRVLIDRRDLHVGRGSGELLRPRARRGAPALQLQPGDAAGVGRRDRPRCGRPLRAGPAGGRLAQLGARQPRPAADRLAGGPAARPPLADAAAHPARHAHHVLRRRAGHGGCAHPP